MPFACKFCIARFGLKGTQIASLPTDRHEVEKHVRVIHGYPETRTAQDILGESEAGKLAARLIEQTGPVVEVHSLGKGDL